jgi:hypothetical protein
MNKFYILVFVFCFQNVKAQKHELSLDNLLMSSFMPPASFATYVKQKGFRIAQDIPFSEGIAFFRSSKDKTVSQVIKRWENADAVVISLQTTSQQDLANWQQGLVQSEYSPYIEKTPSEGKNIAAFQKRNILAKIGQFQDSLITWYSLTLENKKLPPATAIHYAEDLLQLGSHEYLAAVFGATNVKKDQFYFTEKEANKCSILFPNTSSQVIFVWNDEENGKDISFLILGGLANNPRHAAIFSSNQFHKWRSRQGIYLGMSLRELHTLNGKPIEFYDWNTDQPGFVVHQNDGRINLKNLGIQLQCLECIEDGRKPSQPLLTSETMLQANERVLVNSLIILPDKSASSPR